MKNIIVTGGEMFNKGAQAMTFVAVDELKRRFPNHRILLLSEMDKSRPEQEKAQYAFDFMGWYPAKFAKAESNPVLKAMCLLKNRKEYLEAMAIYKNTDLMVDISGYALGANWGYNLTRQYLEHLEFAKAFHIPVYLLPQSFGPFPFTGEHAAELNGKAAELLPTVQTIFAREQEGYDALVGTFHLNNVKLAGDLVLHNRGINLENIYAVLPKYDLPEMDPHSVAVIPNRMNIQASGEDQVIGTYVSVIGGLLELGKTVYILRHSHQDAGICKTLKDSFSADSRVVLLEKEMSCLEFNEWIKHVEFAVASRFHAIVHAYKNAIPCVILGWATKYHDLAAMFGQEPYIFDVRDDDCKGILAAIRTMDRQRNGESGKILSKLSDLQQNNVFDEILLQKLLS